MRVLVAGGNGFIGSHVIDHLIMQGHEPVSLDRYGIPHRTDLEFVFGDVRNKDTVFNTAKRCDAIINLSGILGTSETIEFPQFAFHSNIVGSVNIFDACKAMDKKCVQIAVGNYWMNNPYSISRTAVENIAYQYNRIFKTSISVVRGLNAYGERQKDRPVRKIVPNIMVPLIEQRPITIFGDGEQLMDMIYVGDLAKILIAALVIDHGVYSSCFEAGCGMNLTPSINQLVAMALDVSNTRTLVHKVPMRGGEPLRSVVVGNPETLRPLGFTVDDLTPLKAGLEVTYNWYKSNYAA